MKEQLLSEADSITVAVKGNGTIALIIPADGGRYELQMPIEDALELSQTIAMAVKASQHGFQSFTVQPEA